MNSIMIKGRLARDVEMKYVGSSNTPLAEITLASDQYAKGEKTAMFIDCTVWGKSAEFLNEHCSKGDEILLKGKLKQDSWQGSDGQQKTKFKIDGNEVDLIGKKREGGGQGKSSSNAKPVASADDSFGGEEVPF